MRPEQAIFRKKLKKKLKKKSLKETKLEKIGILTVQMRLGMSFWKKEYFLKTPPKAQFGKRSD